MSIWKCDGDHFIFTYPFEPKIKETKSVTKNTTGRNKGRNRLDAGLPRRR